MREISTPGRIKTYPGTTSLSISQTSATAATTQDGLTINRLQLGRRYYSCKAAFVASFVASTTAKTASVTLNFQHSSDGTSWDNFSTGTVPTAKTFGADTGGTTDYDSVEQSVNLTGARQYIRMQIPAPTYSDCSSGQGVFSGMGVIVFGGADENPAQ
jgi:hypothetical protein